MYKVYRSLNNEEILHDEYNSYCKAMREATYLVNSGLTRVAKVLTIHDTKTIVRGKDGRLFISGKPSR